MSDRTIKELHCYADVLFPFITGQHFEGFHIEVTECHQRRRYIHVTNPSQIDQIVGSIARSINDHNTAVSVFVSPPSRKEEVLAAVKNPTYVSSLQPQTNPESSVIWIWPKPVTIVCEKDGKIRLSFRNGVIETFEILISDQRKGSRLFPDGTKEVGIFDKETFELVNGYRVDIRGAIFLRDPLPLLSSICEIEGRLMVIEWHDGPTTVSYSLSKTAVPDALAESCQELSQEDEQRLARVLDHEYFRQYLEPFFEKVFSPEHSHAPLLFSFSPPAIRTVLHAASRREQFNPLNIIDPRTGKDPLVWAASQGYFSLVHDLANIFPGSFLAKGQEVIAELLYQGKGLCCQKRLGPGETWQWDIVAHLSQIGGSLDPFHQFLINVAQGLPPDESDKATLSSLLPQQIQIVQKIATIYKNPFLQL